MKGPEFRLLETLADNCNQGLWKSSSPTLLLLEIAGCLSQSIFVDGPNCSGYLSAWWRITLSMPPASFWTNTKVTHAAKKRKKFRSKGKVQSKYSVISSQAKATLDALQYIAMLILWLQKKDTGKTGRCLQAFLKPLTDPTYPHLGQSWQSPYANPGYSDACKDSTFGAGSILPKTAGICSKGKWIWQAVATALAICLAGRIELAQHLLGWKRSNWWLETLRPRSLTWTPTSCIQ